MILGCVAVRFGTLGCFDSSLALSFRFPVACDFGFLAGFVGGFWGCG